ncbi:MAG: dTDP-glucose 4,6-dehydratase [Gammaproteobacteria bacterium]|jgi:dTDP-glucose 4,6-dehydratase|nr:dTDP-glucose 4,6-dehydratase [Gammaproteobacteria bacterium]
MKTAFIPKHVLITGGAGFIGANFVHHLINTDPHLNIIVLDKLTYAGNKRYLSGLSQHQQFSFYQGDIVDSQLIQQLLRKHQINAIVHFAAESHVDRSITGPSTFVQTNIVGTFTLLEAARLIWLEEQHYTDNQCRFHHISTDEVFGSLDKTDLPFSEKTPYAPNSPYSATKAGSDHLVRAYQHTYGLPTTLTNCSNNYGPYQHAEKLIPTIIRACQHQEPIPVYGDGSNIRDWLYVEDHCRGIDTVLRYGRTGDIYNIGGNQELTNLAIVKLICHKMDERFPEKAPHERFITFVRDRPGHDWRYAINADKMKNSMGWQPTETIESGIEKTLDFYLGEK